MCINSVQGEFCARPPPLPKNLVKGSHKPHTYTRTDETLGLSFIFDDHYHIDPTVYIN